ncbi:phage tail protein [Pyxidicoccus trucidator]|uniref:phage tail protein n=1 Tax=Pyxidicoccus trucidator TaxID=2709662 RepID=UPI0013D9A083|nr:phage tail protein [Pyxidicoccus trucidator]
MRSPDIQRLLPGVFQRTAQPASPLAALLEVMEVLHAPSEGVLSGLESHFDPRRAPDRFVPFLARWVGMDLPVTTGLGRLRELVAAAVDISRWRGTARGLLLFLTTATGRTDFEVDEAVPGPDGLPRPFHVRVRAPAEVEAHRLLLERIIEREKPAYVTYELLFVQPPKGAG